MQPGQNLGVRLSLGDAAYDERLRRDTRGRDGRVRKELAAGVTAIRRGQGRNDDAQFFVRYCFGNPAHADAFCDRFGGGRLTATVQQKLSAGLAFVGSGPTSPTSLKIKDNSQFCNFMGVL